MTTDIVTMIPGAPRGLQVDTRYIHQNAMAAVRDVYDAVIELITNADDRYVWLEKQGIPNDGVIEIDVERRRKSEPSIVRVRDHADGMTAQVMEKKLCQLGQRVSGMNEGLSVRGTNSRGAKDVAVLGGVTFESIAEDGLYHKCEITQRLKFIPYQPSQKPTVADRRALRIAKGTGTVVTVKITSPNRIPQHEKLARNIRDLVALSDILIAKDRKLVLRDLNQQREMPLTRTDFDGNDVLKERFQVPGYPGVEAKLTVKRARKPFESASLRFRRGGIQIKSRHGIHESTYFASELEADPSAFWFYGRLKCEFIDDLWNDYDDLYEKGLPAPESNPCPIVDPQRKAGLRREHPFTKTLFQEALKRFRPLVDEERKRQEKDRTRIESEQTRKRLNALERAASQFMQQHLTEPETTRDQDSVRADSSFMERGFALYPPFVQIVQGHSARFALHVRQESFPELSVGDTVEVMCLSDEISSDRRYGQLEVHPSGNGVLRANWLIKGERPTNASGVQARVGSIVSESIVEVLGSEKEKYAHIQDLCFNKNRYTVVVNRARNISLLAPCPGMIDRPRTVDINCSNRAFRISGDMLLRPVPELGIAKCTIRVFAEQPERVATIEARIDGRMTSAELVSCLPPGSPIKIEIVPEEFGNQTSLWKENVLRIAGKHPVVSRYLGPAPPYTRQEDKHFRVLLADIVAEAVCQRVLSRKAWEDPEDFQDADWDRYYAEYSKLMKEFLMVAHESQVKDP